MELILKGISCLPCAVAADEARKEFTDAETASRDTEREIRFVRDSACS